MNFVAQQNAYFVVVESQVSINFILVQSNTNVQLMDIERNLAILSLMDSKRVCLANYLLICNENQIWQSTIPRQNGASQLTATFRCQSNTTRLEMKLICNERSTSDLVQLYVSLNIQQPRLAILKSFPLVCLCRHVRCHPFEWSASTPYGSLTLQGGFSQADAHNWIASCLPDIPDKVPSDEEIHFYFRNDQWQTKLAVHYR